MKLWPFFPHRKSITGLGGPNHAPVAPTQEMSTTMAFATLLRRLMKANPPSPLGEGYEVPWASTTVEIPISMIKNLK